MVGPAWSLGTGVVCFVGDEHDLREFERHSFPLSDKTHKDGGGMVAWWLHQIAVKP